MAIVKMRKLNLIAMSYDKDRILNALHRTNAAEVTLHPDAEGTMPLLFTDEKLQDYLTSVETALQILTDAVAVRMTAKAEVLKDGFDVTYSEFLSMQEKKSEANALVEKINALTDEKNRLKAELVKFAKQKETAKTYAFLTTPFDAYRDTAHTRIRLGVVLTANREPLLQDLAQVELCTVDVLREDENGAVLCIAAHKSVASETDGILSARAFVDCPYTGEKTGAQTYQEVCEAEKELVLAMESNADELLALKDGIRLLKVYSEYLAFTLEKEMTDDKLRSTHTTFLLEAYVPAPAEEAVKTELQNETGAVFMEFSDPTEEETPPTLLQNNGVVSNFEGITNTYSVPHYREFDPNAVMAFFYSLFMGFIIGDAGYGLLMLIVGGYLWWKNRARPTGMSRLAGAFSIGGIFAILWGALFNSFFGFMLLPITVMPSAQSDMWHIAGIAVPAVLVIAMLIGVVQLFVGYVCKAVQNWRRGAFWDGVFDGVVWAIFSVGVILAILGFVEEANVAFLLPIGGIMAGATLVIAILTAGRKEKFFGKFTKGFGAAYGIINYASDILSYARLYGLMLSGAVIATIIKDYSVQFITSGNVLFIILAIVLFVVGNAFNLVISLLGAYIHDARLQYVEFYGRFYEGDGELFKPLGSQYKYVHLVHDKRETVNSK